MVPSTGMSEATVLPLLALVAAVVLLLKKESRTWALVATVAAGVIVAASFGWLSVAIKGIDLNLILSGVLVLSGGFLFRGVAEKTRVASATTIVLVGALLLIAALRLF